MRGFVTAAVLGVGLFYGSAGSALADVVGVDGKMLLLDTARAPAKHRVTWKASKDVPFAPAFDPSTDGSDLLLRWSGASSGQTALIPLDPAKWTALGSPPGSRGYRYKDPSGSRGGVRSIVHRQTSKGRRLKLVAKGENWPWEIEEPLESAQVYLRTGDRWLCGEFGGELRKNLPGRFLAKDAPAPSDCVDPTTYACDLPCDDGPELLFRSGFEPDTFGDAELTQIHGVDHSVGPPNDWDAIDVPPSPIVWAAIGYEGGLPSQRYATLAPDPTDSSNTVLHFWLHEPSAKTEGGEVKGRVQLTMHTSCMARIYHRVRLYLHPDFNLLLEYLPEINWLMLLQYWTDGNWTGEPHPFRLSVDLYKPPGEATEFNIRARGTIMPIPPEEGQLDVWVETNTDVAVPVGQWMTVEAAIEQGSEGSGRFWLAVTPDGGTQTVVFDVHHATEHLGETCRDGFRYTAPLQLYTSEAIVNYVGNAAEEEPGVERALQMYWDDLEIWRAGVP